MNPNFSITEPPQALQMYTKWPFSPELQHQYFPSFYSRWSSHNSKTVLEILFPAVLKWFDLQQNQVHQWMEGNTSHAKGEIAQRGHCHFQSDLNNSYKSQFCKWNVWTHSKNINNFINTFICRFLVWTWQIMKLWSHLIYHLSEVSVVITKLFHAVSPNIRLRRKSPCHHCICMLQPIFLLFPCK